MVPELAKRVMGGRWNQEGLSMLSWNSFQVMRFHAATEPCNKANEDRRSVFLTKKRIASHQVLSGSSAFLRTEKFSIISALEVETEKEIPPWI